VLYLQWNEIATPASIAFVSHSRFIWCVHYIVFHSSDYRIPHAIMMYFFRPNVAAKQRMKEQLKEIIPDWLDPQDTLGLPIRGKLDDPFPEMSVVVYQRLLFSLPFMLFNVNGRIGQVQHGKHMFGLRQVHATGHGNMA
jgi:hypothetical protein